MLFGGSILYQVENIYMKHYKGDQEYNRLKHKIDSHQPLSETDTLKLIFPPLMKSKQKEEELAIQAAELAKATDEKTKIFTIAASSLRVCRKRAGTIQSRFRLISAKIPDYEGNGLRDTSR